MGWTFTFSHTQKEQAVSELLDVTRYGPGTKILASRTVGNHLWMAMTNDTYPSGFIVLYLLQFSRHDRCWGYKGMDECSGPYVCDCPLSLLKMVPCPADSETAQQWRESVRLHHAKRANKPTIAAGMICTLNGKAYTLVAPAGKRRGWIATDAAGKNWRIPASQLANHPPMPAAIASMDDDAIMAALAA